MTRGKAGHHWALSWQMKWYFTKRTKQALWLESVKMGFGFLEIAKFYFTTYIIYVYKYLCCLNICIHTYTHIFVINYIKMRWENLPMLLIIPSISFSASILIATTSSANNWNFCQNLGVLSNSATSEVSHVYYLIKTCN